MSQNHEKTLHVNRFYKLNHAVGPIPAGIYRLERVDALCWSFSVGKSRAIHFSIMFGNGSLLSEVSFVTGKQERMREREFVRKYYFRLAQLERDKRNQIRSLNGASPVTCCMMPERYERIYGSMRSFVNQSDESLFGPLPGDFH